MKDNPLNNVTRCSHENDGHSAVIEFQTTAVN